MPKRKKSRKAHRSRRSALTSAGACGKVMDKCGMSKSYCDDSGFRSLLKEAKQNYDSQVRDIREGIAAAKHNRNVALKACRKDIRAQQQQASVARHMRESMRINGWRRRSR